MLAAAPGWLRAAASAKKRSAPAAASAKGGRNSSAWRASFDAAKGARSPEEAEGARRTHEAVAVVAGLTPAEARRASTNGSRTGLAAAARIRSFYRRIPLDLPLDHRFARRSAHAQLVAFHVCAGPHSTFIPGVAVGPVKSLAGAAHLSEKKARDGLRELAFARLLRSDTRAGVFWIPSVTEALPPERLGVHRGRETALRSHIPPCRLRNEIAGVIRAQFRTESLVWAKRALNPGGSKEEGAPSPDLPGPKTSETTNAPTAKTGVLNG